MPGFFTHIYTARRVADLLSNGKFPDWPDIGGALDNYDPVTCGRIMKTWEKFTHLGAVGPDMFYLSQDWNNGTLGPISDELMFAFATYYFLDSEKEVQDDNWQTLLTILAEANSQLAALLRFLMKLDNIWTTFLKGWNATIGPLVADIENLADDLTGGVLSEFGVVMDELKEAFKLIAEEELLTFKDIFSGFDTCVQKGFGEKLFLWSDMSHYRRPAALCQSFVKQANLMAAQARDLEQQGRAADARNMHQQSEQFLAFAMGYMTHVGTDTVAHSFVNAQCGGPYRNHPQRHHLIENHIDSWNYVQTADGGRLRPDDWGAKDEYPYVSQSALWFAIQMRPKDPHGDGRPDGPFASDDDRNDALDVDGEMPDWMSNAIVAAMMDCYQDPDEHPQIFQGDAFQSSIDVGLMTRVFNDLTGGGLNKPFQDLLTAIAPTPPFPVRKGFPLPWEIKTTYKILYTFFRLLFNGTWELQKPQKPDFVIFPPASDVENLFQPPDLSGIDSSNPIDVCEAIVSLFEYIVKSIDAVIKLVGDLIKMLVSPSTYLLRLGLYELAMMVWDLVNKTHELLAHTGFFVPHPAQSYPGGELRLTDEIDMPLITMGGTVDSAFRAALDSAFDPFGNLDKNQDVIGVGHSVKDPNYPYYPVLRWQTNGDAADYEYRRPWAWPSQSPVQQVTGPDTLKTTPTETYNPFLSFGEGPDEAFQPLSGSPYPIGTQPDVFFREDGVVDPAVRSAYEQAQTPWDTDQLNIQHLMRPDLRFSPLGDPVPFSAHLIAQLTNDTGYSAQFNLDSDRGFAYLTWDWIRQDAKVADSTGIGILGLEYQKPVIQPEGDASAAGLSSLLNPIASEDWVPGTPLLLKYKDAPRPPNGPPSPVKQAKPRSRQGTMERPNVSRQKTKNSSTGRGSGSTKSRRSKKRP